MECYLSRRYYIYKYADNLTKGNITYDGWYIGTSENPSNTYIYLSGKEGYNNTLYYPHKEGIDSNSCYGYWLASPSAFSDEDIMLVGCGGWIHSNSNYYGTLMAARPVISLPTSLVNQ